MRSCPATARRIFVKGAAEFAAEQDDTLKLRRVQPFGRLRRRRAVGITVTSRRSAAILGQIPQEVGHSREIRGVDHLTACTPMRDKAGVKKLLQVEGQ
jgi:hypothetical protein